jgi:hypothetical protein
VREIRTLRAMWRALETGPRQLLNGHEEGNLGYKPRRQPTGRRASARPYRGATIDLPGGNFAGSSVSSILNAICPRQLA